MHDGASSVARDRGMGDEFLEFPTLGTRRTYKTNMSGKYARYQRRNVSTSSGVAEG